MYCNYFCHQSVHMFVESVVNCAMSVFLYGPKVKFCTKLTAPSSASWTASRRCAQPVMLTEMSTTRQLQFITGSEVWSPIGVNRSKRAKMQVANLLVYSPCDGEGSKKQWRESHSAT